MTNKQKAIYRGNVDRKGWRDDENRSLYGRGARMATKAEELACIEGLSAAKNQWAWEDTGAGYAWVNQLTGVISHEDPRIANPGATII